MHRFAQSDADADPRHFAFKHKASRNCRDQITIGLKPHSGGTNLITIYHLNMSRSERIIWLMEELGLPYQLEKYQRGPDMLAPPSLRQVSPLGKAPAIRDGDLTLIESGAIVEYIINRHAGGKLGVPVSSPDYPRYLQWMHFAEGTAMTQGLIELFFS